MRNIKLSIKNVIIGTVCTIMLISQSVAKNFIDEDQTSYKFKNELGSIMTIEVPSSGGGSVTGRYKSGVSDPNTYPLIGFISESNQVIAFTVSYKKEGSIAAWAGQVMRNSSNGLLEIHTLWHLVRPTHLKNMWQDTNAGFDIFTQVSD